MTSGVCSSSWRDDFVENDRLEALRVAIGELPFFKHLLQMPNGRRAVLTVAMVVSMYWSMAAFVSSFLEERPS